MLSQLLSLFSKTEKAQTILSFVSRVNIDESWSCMKAHKGLYEDYSVNLPALDRNQHNFKVQM